MSKCDKSKPCLYLKRDPIRKKFCRAFGALEAAFSRKNEWCSTAHFQRCFAAFSLWSLDLKDKENKLDLDCNNISNLHNIGNKFHLNTNVCSRSRPCNITAVI